MESQRGNIIVYLLIGLVMFGALLSGLWWVKTRSGGETQSAPVAQEEQPATTDEQAPPETDVDQDAVPAAPENDAPVAAPAPQNPDALPPESQTSRPTPGPNEVASSGPVENSLITAGGLGVLAYMSSSYVRSRRSH